MNPRQAISLIELLVVIAIIGVLSSLLLGTMSWIRDSARGVSCANKMRQLGIAFEVFASDRRGVYPPAQLRSYNMSMIDGVVWLGNGGNGTRADAIHMMRYTGESPWGDNNWNTWNSYITPYLEGDHAKDKWDKSQALLTMFQCPSHPRLIKQDVASTFGPVATAGLYSNSETGVSYGINTAYLDTNPCTPNYNARPGDLYPRGRAGWPGFGLGLPGVHDNSRFKRKIDAPGRTIQLAEHYGQPMPYENRAIWTEPPFARIPVDRTGTPLPVPDGFGSFDTTRGFPLTDKFIGHALLVSHRGRSNYLFVDGRVQALSPWETCSADPAQPNLWTGR